MYCSPIAAESYKKHKTCFSIDALRKLATAWNQGKNGEPITDIKNMGKTELWRALNKRMAKDCGGSSREWCWPEKLGMKSDSDIKNTLRPEKPKEWYKNPNAWLSNFEIEDVMKQYEQDRANEYIFLGVYPIDFESKSVFGQCLYEEICNLDISKFYKKGYRYIGMILNLDKHDEPGSHWTSLFACIEPSAKNFGAYYYDSVARRPPPEVESFMKSLEKQAKQLPGGEKAKFKKCWSKKQHQRGNNECGMFSMYYQVRWLQMLKKNKDISFTKIINIQLKDEDVHKMRDEMFRPNVKAVVDKK